MKVVWDRSTIGNYCEVIAGQSPQGKFYNTDGQGMAFYQGKKDFGDKSLKAPTTWTTQTTKIARKDDILMSVRAPVGPINFATEDICIGRGLAAIRSEGQLDVHFLFYQLLHLQPEIRGKEGAVFASINKSKIAALPIGIPSLPEQQRIVGILDEAFAGIATAKATAEKNLQNARALFESHLNAVFSQPGEGWVERKLDDVCEFQNGFAFKSRTFKASGFPVLRISNIQDGRIDRDNRLVFFDPKDYRENLDRYRIVEDDLVIAMSGATTGKLAFNTESTVLYLNQRVGKFEPRKNLNKRFLYHFLSTKVKENLRISAGAAQPNLSTEQIKSLVLPLPPLPEQQRIVGILDDLSEETRRLEALYEQKLTALEALKNSLLHQAFAGAL